METLTMADHDILIHEVWFVRMFW